MCYDEVSIDLNLQVIDSEFSFPLESRPSCVLYRTQRFVLVPQTNDIDDCYSFCSSSQRSAPREPWSY